MFSNVTEPGSFFMMGWPISLFDRCSMTPTEMDRPLTCLNWATVMESISTWYAYVAIGSNSASMAGSCQKAGRC